MNHLGNRIRGSRALAVVLAVLTMGALVGALATPASAASVPVGQQFNPSDNSPGGGDDTVLSDRFDGTDSTAHLTTVLDTNGVANEWFVCDDTAGPYTSDPTDSAAKCASIGVDTTPTNPGGSGAGDPDNAFDLNWDIPQTLHYNDGTTANIDEQFVWVESWGCDNATTRTTANCDVVDWDEVQVDDTSDDPASADKTTAGEITTPTNGSNVQNTGFTARASTSDDVVEVHFCLDDDAGSGNDDGGEAVNCDVEIVDVTPDSTSGGASTWHADFSAADVLDNREQGLFIYEDEDTSGVGQSGSDLCGPDNPDCGLDSHYINSTRGTLPGDTAFVNFPNATTAGNVCGDTTTGSTTPNANSVTNDAGDNEDVQGCILDSSGNYVTDDVDWAMQVTPQDLNATTTDERCFTNIIFTTEGTAVDSQDDLCFESVLGSLGWGDTADQQVNFFTAGTYTITFCADTNNNGACDSGELSATGTKTVVANRDNITDLIDLTSNVATNGKCSNATRNVQAPVGSTVQVTECVTDNYGNPIDKADLSWFVNANNSTPNSGTYTQTDSQTDATGTGDATFAGGAANTQAYLYSCASTAEGGSSCSWNSGGGNGNQIIVNWQGSTTPGGTDLTLRSTSRHRIRHRRGTLRFAGDLTTSTGSNCEGHLGGNLIQIHRGTATGKVVVSATTAASGNYLTRRVLITYGRKIRKKFVATFAGNSFCTAATSNAIFVRGFR